MYEFFDNRNTPFGIKPFIANEFFSDFIEFFTLPDLLNYWTKTKYNLGYNKLPEDLMRGLFTEIFAFGIRFYKLVEIETKSFSGSEGDSFTSLVDEIFDGMFLFDAIWLEKYKEAKRKYSGVDRKEIFNLFEDSIRNILSYSSASFSPTSIKSSDTERYYKGRLQFMLKKFPFFVGEAVVGIFDWASKLGDKEANIIFAEIKQIRKTKEGIISNKEVINLLEVYGFGTMFWRKCGTLGLFDSSNKVGKEGSLRILRLLWRRL